MHGIIEINYIKGFFDKKKIIIFEKFNIFIF